jgi:hypothetical protein
MPSPQHAAEASATRAAIRSPRGTVAVARALVPSGRDLDRLFLSMPRS